MGEGKKQVSFGIGHRKWRTMHECYPPPYYRGYRKNEIRERITGRRQTNQQLRILKKYIAICTFVKYVHHGLQLDEQSNSFTYSIITAIVNCDAYHQFPLMDKWESMLSV